MAGRMGGGGLDQQQSLPVFVFPTQLTFYVRDPQSHRQIMTIYNPYDFHVAYEVLSTAPNSYSVHEPRGTLKSRCCVDIAIRRVELHQKGSSDEKFRVVLRRRGGRSDEESQQGYRDVPSQVYDHRSESDLFASSSSSGAGASSSNQAGFHGFSTSAERQVGSMSSSSSVHGQAHQYPLQGGANRQGRPSWLLAMVAALCIVCLSAPTLGNGQQTTDDGLASYFPQWFHLGVSQKLVAAYVLGLITAAFLQA